MTRSGDTGRQGVQSQAGGPPREAENTAKSVGRDKTGWNHTWGARSSGAGERLRRAPSSPLRSSSLLTALHRPERRLQLSSAGMPRSPWTLCKQAHFSVPLPPELRQHGRPPHLLRWHDSAPPLEKCPRFQQLGGFFHSTITEC